MRLLFNNARFLIPFSAIFYALMSACVKAVGPSIPIYETIVFRAGVSVVVIAILLRKASIPFKAVNFSVLMFRSITGLTAMACNFYVLNHLTLGDASMLVNTFPLFVALLSIFILGEKPSPALWLWITLAVIGVSIILKPQFNFFNYAGFIALISALLTGVVVVAIHQSHETEPALRIAFYFTTSSTLFCFPLLFYHAVMPDFKQFLFLMGAGTCGTIGQITMTKAYGLEDVSRLAPLASVGVIFSFILDILFWAAIPNLWTLAGGTLVLLACAQIARLEKPEPVIN